MFEPPRDLIFHGGFEEAKIHAVTLGRWLVSEVFNVFRKKFEAKYQI